MIECIFGLPGQGKSTYMAMLAQKALKSGQYERVYCNFYLSGCYSLEYDDLGIYDFRDCLILIDEAMNVADSREYRSFDKEKKYFFSNHRHFNIDIVYFTQAWDDVDKRIRNNTELLSYIKKVGPFSVVTPITRSLIVEEGRKNITVGYNMHHWITGSVCYRPKWYKYFDSWETRKLPALPSEKEYIYPYPCMLGCISRFMLRNCKEIIKFRNDIAKYFKRRKT